MSGLDRRAFLSLAGAAVLMPGTAVAQPPRADMLIVNALGGLDDPNVLDFLDRRRLSDRILADARASGLDAVNVTMGYVSGDEEPFEQSVREIARWDARLRDRPMDLFKVLTADDILRARRERKIGVMAGGGSRRSLGSIS